MPQQPARRSILSAGLALGSSAVLASTPAAHADGRAGDPASSTDRTTQQPPLIGPATDPDLHVMSFNIRYPAGGDTGARSWDERRGLVDTLLATERPTVIGIQESYLHQGQDILAGLGSGYDWVHHGRRHGSVDESTPICYDSERLRVREYDHQWLSDEPRLIGSATWGNRIPRMLTWVRFHDSATDREFVCLNTHFDHESEDARVRSAEMVLRIVGELDVPVVITGDFNSVHDSSAAYRTLVTDGGLSDVWKDAAEQLTPEYATFNGWTAAVTGDRIDWVLAGAGFEIAEVGINPWSRDGNNPSDHWPVQSLVRLA